MRLLNQGSRITGVINTDAHDNHHGSGFRRNYVASPTDEPGFVRWEDVVHETWARHVVMTSGPYLEVGMGTPNAVGSVGPGDDLALPGGRGWLRVRVQSPNWFDIDRVRVLFNGRPAPGLDFTRTTHPRLFENGTMKFDQRLDLELRSDTHVIVVAAGENSRLGEVMGSHANQMPIAVSNPIFVDVDGDGFEANLDTLGLTGAGAGADGEATDDCESHEHPHR